MTLPQRYCCLKVDVDTYEGMRAGVPRLLDVFEKFGVSATFFLSFGPDNSGKAIWNVLRRRGFLKKLLRTDAPRLYGWRTMLSGTLLPSRLIAVQFPDLVREIEARGHEVGVHAWDHRLWQDHLDRLSRTMIQNQFDRCFDSFEKILGRRPESTAAPAWYATATSLEVQDSYRLTYASDVRGGPPCFIEFSGRRFETLQIPTTQPCLEELLDGGRSDPIAHVPTVLNTTGTDSMVVPLHAEVEGGIYRGFLETLLQGLLERGFRVQTLQALAHEILSCPQPSVPTRRVCLDRLPGRPERVLIPQPLDTATQENKADGSRARVDHPAFHDVNPRDPSSDQAGDRC